jgi:NADH dehydrogenase FAD-containing subunit
VTVVGGGFTGIEVMSVLAQRYPHKTLQLIHTRDQLLHQYSNNVHHRVHKRLTHRNVDIHYRTRVTALNDQGLTLDNRTTLPSDITLMTAGIQKNDETHRDIPFVSGTLHAQEYKNIFICGDVNPHSIGTTAHNAMIEGRRVGRLIVDQIQIQ